MTSPTRGARLRPPPQDDDPERAHTVAGAWLERIRTLEHRHVDALELHLAMSAAAA